MTTTQVEAGLAADTHRGRRTKTRPARKTPAPGISPPPKMRRPRAQYGLAVALIAVGGLLAAWVTSRVGHTSDVLAMRDTVSRGSVITADDLTTARINSDPALHTVPAGDRDSIIGRHAVNDLSAGSLITPSSVTTLTVPAAGLSLVGLSFTPAQMPAQSLRAGDPVRIVSTPRSQDSPPTDAVSSIAATVVDERTADNGSGATVVDVTVSSADAPLLAADAATGRIALILDSSR